MKFKKLLPISVMLFGMFFGAGNLIFPGLMGQQAGRSIWPALIGFLITGAGLPLLSVAALGAARSEKLQDLGDKVGRKYSIFFTCALYLTIGPFFAIPRCAATSFSTGASLFAGLDPTWMLALFSAVFFVIVLILSMRPGKILLWVGKVLTPVFLVFLAAMVIVALVNSGVSAGSVAPVAPYDEGPFFRGFLEGYNTMDVLAGLAFGIVVVDVIRKEGVTDPKAVAGTTIKAGILSCVIMAVIYAGVTFAGLQSLAYTGGPSADGAATLSAIAGHYFGIAGQAFLTVTVTLACLKTAIGLVTSCAESFEKMFPRGPKYRLWVVIFVVVAFLVANLGLSAIVTYAVPVLMFLYPLAIVLVLLSLFGRLFGYDRHVFRWVTVLTLLAALFDLMNTLPEAVQTALRLDVPIGFAQKFLPLFDLGMGWIVPAAVGLVIGLILHFVRPHTQMEKL